MQDAETNDSPAKHRAFLASRLGPLSEVRSRIFEFGRSSGQPVWVSELSAPWLAGKTLGEIQIACLRQVRLCDTFVCLLDGTYGTTWDESDLSILELEIFMAALAGNTAHFILIEPLEMDARLGSLLKVLKASCPQANMLGPMPISEVPVAVERLLTEQRVAAPDDWLGRINGFLAKVRSPKLQPSFNAVDVQFLNGGLSAFGKQQLDREKIACLIAEAQAQPNIPEKLAHLWLAVRALSDAPYADAKYREFLPLWELALAEWGSASAWYSLHGHLYLGRLAAVNTSLGVGRSIDAATRRVIGPAPIFATRGSVASEYYSIAKTVQSTGLRRELYSKALWNVNQSLLNQETADLSGLLLIRAAIKTRLGDVRGGIGDFRAALAMRESDGEGPERIGECELELGTAMFGAGNRRGGMKYMEAGVERMRWGSKHTFTVKGMRQLAAAYLKIGKRQDAVAILVLALRLARQYEMRGAVVELERMLRDVGEDPT